MIEFRDASGLVSESAPTVSVKAVMTFRCYTYPTTRTDAIPVESSTGFETPHLARHWSLPTLQKPRQCHQGTEVCFHCQTCTTMHHNGYHKAAYFLFSTSLIMTKCFQILKPDEMYVMQKFVPSSKGTELTLTYLTCLTAFP